MHALARAVIVFDEIQALPLRCVHLFNNATNFLVRHCGASAVLSTATQPLLHRVDPIKGALALLPEHELVPDVPGLFKALRRVEVVDARKAGGWTDQELVALALAQVEEAGSCLMVVNTKKAAKRLYGLCVAQSSATVVHLSTSMCPAHRRRALGAIRRDLEGKAPLLCISTQLIEAGVDVDFGSVVRFLAGLDSIAQSAGRCNRNGTRPWGQAFVVNPAEENLGSLPEIRTGRDVASRVLDEFRQDPAAFGGDLLGPRVMDRFFHYYFFQRAKEMDYPVKADEVGRDDSLLQLLSTNPLAVGEFQRANGTSPAVPMRQSFKAAAEAFQVIDAPTRGVLVPYSDEGKALVLDLQSDPDPQRRAALLGRAQSFAVNVFPHELQQLWQAGALQELVESGGLLALASRFYHPAFGLCTEPVNDLEVLCV
jgi:CRISPR-associated endonuclease/helicase Cas3